MSPNRLTPSILPSLPFPPPFSCSHLFTQPCNPPSSSTPGAPSQPYSPHLLEFIFSSLLLSKRNNDHFRVPPTSGHICPSPPAAAARCRDDGGIMVLPLWSPLAALSGGIFLALLHSFLLHCQAAAAVFALLLVSAHNLALLATPPPLMESPRSGPTDMLACVFNQGVFVFLIMIAYQCKLLVLEPDCFLPSHWNRREKKIDSDERRCQPFCLKLFRTVESY